MRIGLAVFAYCRREHLSKVLEGLKENENVNMVYFFQDGLKCESDRQDWEETAKVISEFDWCEKKVIRANTNKGLSQSIVEGIELVLQENDAIVILEDDCVPMPAFVSFMKQCFYKYKDVHDVFSIAGYSWPVKIEKEESDIYFCGRPCSWGWGTWKDRWQCYTQDANMIRSIKKDREASRRLATWGDDLENMLVNNYLGYNDSWYVYWALYMIQHDVYAINPYLALIDNIGFDGTGVHCGVTNRFDVKGLDKRECGSQFSLRDDVNTEKMVEQAFIDLYGNDSVLYSEVERPKILVYGIGRFYKRNAKSICEKFMVDSFVDKKKKDLYYAGIDIIHPRQINEKKYDYVLIMIENTQIMQEARETLIEDYSVASEKILIGNEMYK